jgi:phenylacetate-coenzyme A ligase PaaK-like adenylate-forming protein
VAANYYDIEPAEQKRIALKRLFRYIREYVYPYSPYLRKFYKAQGVDVAKLKTEDDLRRLPIIDKRNMREDPTAFILRPTFPGVANPPGIETARIDRASLLKYAKQALTNRPREYSQLVRNPTFKEQIRRRALLEWMPVHFHASTGSTGIPTPAAYTHYDLTQVLPELASLLVLPKKRDPDEPYHDWAERALNIFPGAPHLAFFCPVLAKTAVGTSAFDTFGGSVIPTDRQISLFYEGGFTSMTSVPSYLGHWLRRAKVLQDEGKIGKLKEFRRVILGAEPVSETMRNYLRGLALELGAHPRFRIYQTLGMTELKWAFLECSEGSGIHLHPRFHYWELLHPETREPVREGEPGVLVFSHIDWRGTVLVRYWTGDLIKGGMVYTRCPHCGYTFPRIFPPICRAEKDFTKLKGARVDLSDLIEAVRSTPGVKTFQISLESENPGEEFSRDLLKVCLTDDRSRERAALEADLAERVKTATEVSPDVVVFEEDEPALEQRLFARNGIKAEYVVERRQLHI